MFRQKSSAVSSDVVSHSHPPKRKNKNNKRKKLKIGRLKQSRLSSTTMSIWAENFTAAATWQLKHQVAYWKAKAKAYQFENQILHEIVRKNYAGFSKSVPLKTENLDDSPETPDDQELEDSQKVGDDDFEISEAFINFLAANEKYRQDARLERERYNAKQDENVIDKQNEEPSISLEQKKLQLQNLYGDRCLQISALEMSLMADFMNDCDKDKPIYWPNIPFNFN